MRVSTHAQKRMQQRGLTMDDIELVMQFGTEAGDGIYMRAKDIKRAESEFKKLISQLQRLSGKYVIIQGDTIVTTYHPSERRKKKILR